MVWNGWAVDLNGIVLSGSDAGSQAAWNTMATGACSGQSGKTVYQALTLIPDGLGIPEIRTEDVTYLQRDGVSHFGDWYNPRIITLESVTVCNDGCPGCPSMRQKVRNILDAWSRQCAESELVVWTDCTGTSPRSLNGPFGVVGRPRQAIVNYMEGGAGCAEMTLRFDSVDHRMYILDACGTPGSGGTTLTMNPIASNKCRTYNRCYSGSGSCYTTSFGASGGAAVTGTNSGSLCSYLTITLTGQLTNPRVENTTTGDSITYGASIPAGQSVTIDTSTGTATRSDGTNVTYLLSGNTRMQVNPGTNVLRLVSFAPTDNGTASVTWRPSVVNA